MRIDTRSLWVWAAAVGSLASLPLGCGSEESSGSKLSSAGGNGGSGGTGGTGVGGISVTGGSGGVAADAGSGGGGATPAVLHDCTAESTAPETCAAKVFSGSFSTRTNGSLEQLEGVTEVTGRLEIQTLVGVDRLRCLTRVGDDLDIDLSGSSGEVGTFWGLRSLVFIGGGIDLTASSSVHIDCAFRHLESLGTRYATGGAVDLSGARGVLELGRLQEVTHIRIKGSQLERLELPSNVALTMGQLGLERNSALTAVTGFQNVTLQPSSIQVAGAYAVRIVDNAQLSTCRVNQLADLFRAAGFSTTAITVSGNAPDC